MENIERVAILLERLSRLLQGAMNVTDLKSVQWETLRYLSRANRFSRTPMAVTAYLGLTKGTVSQTLGALVRKGLIEKTSRSDRRRVDLHLTNAGKDVLADDPVLSVAATAGRIAGESPERLETVLEGLLEALLRERGSRTFGLCRSCRFFEDRNGGASEFRCGLLDVPLNTGDSQKICIEHEMAA